MEKVAGLDSAAAIEAGLRNPNACLIAAAYVRAVRGCKDAVKNAKNPHLGNNYADLGAVLEAVRESFLSNGLWLLQAPGRLMESGDNPAISMGWFLIHESGQMITGETHLPASQWDKKLGANKITAQTAGSAFSYMRRYQWLAIAGLAQVDDDGEEASQIDTTEPPQEYTSHALKADYSELEKAIDEALKAKDMTKLQAVRTKVQESSDKALREKYMNARKAIKGEE